MEYSYQAVGVDGQEVSGVIEGASRREVLRGIRHQGLIVTFLQEQRPKNAHSVLIRKRLKPREMLLTMHEFTTLLESGVPIPEAVGSIAHSSHHPHITGAFTVLEQEIKHGEGFASAFRKAGLKLPWYFRQLADSGEMTGHLSQALRGGVNQMEFDYKMQSEIRGALVYPTVLVLTGIASVILVFTNVVPRFAVMLHGHMATIPLLAKIILGVGMWFNDHAQIVGALSFLTFIFGVYALSQASIRRRLLEALSGLPLIGPWLIEAEIGRWAATLSTLLSSKVELINSLTLARDSIQFKFLRSRMSRGIKLVREGQMLSEAMRQTRFLADAGCDLVTVGERSGKLPELLRSLANLYEATSHERMKGLLQLIEPAAILIIGAVIGLIIMGVMLAITSLNTVI